MIFRRKLKIKQIAMAGSGEFIFTFGLARDGKVYSWNVLTGKWQLHTQQATLPASAPQEVVDAN